MATILMIEDDEVFGKKLGKLLQEADHKVFWARNSNEVFDCLGVQKIELVLLDIMLPKVNGFEIFKLMKKDEKYKSIPVVVVTGLSESAAMDKAARMGVKDYIIKANLDMSKLVADVRRVYVPAR